MCWTQGVSLALGVTGVASAIYHNKKSKDKNIKQLTAPLAYFAGMELLQFLSYFYVDSCGLAANQYLTIFSYLHICFQTFFFNMVYMYFIPDKIRKKIQPFVYSVCAVLTLLMFLSLFPIAGAAKCTLGTTLCGENMCTVSGDWHIAWSVPLYVLPHVSNIPYYVIAAFIMPLLYGAWKPLLIGSFFGPGIAYLSTSNPNEVPAIWCFFSVILFIIIMDSKLKEKLKVKRWFLWPKKFWVK